MWKLDTNLLINKARLWTSKDNWDLMVDETWVCIQNKSTEKVLTISNSGAEVIEDTMVPFKSSQMWTKGEPNKDGYFTLTSIDSGKVLTANWALSLTIEGKNLVELWTSQIQNCVILPPTYAFYIKPILVLFTLADYLESSVGDLLDEAKAMMRVSKHDHIVNIQGICVKNDVAYLLMEYCASGCLYDYLQSNEENLRAKLHQQNDYSKFRNWICQVAEGMAFLAWNNIIHVSKVETF